MRSSEGFSAPTEEGGTTMKKTTRMILLAACLALCLSLLTLTAGAETAHADHCICGQASTAAVEGHSHSTGTDIPTWQAWESSASLPSQTGYYYLTQNVAMGDAWLLYENQSITLCLNGYNITTDDSGYGSVINVGQGVSLAICDCEGTGVISYTGTGNKPDGVNNYGKFDFYGGTITGVDNGVSNASYDSSTTDYGMFHMYGGTISQSNIGVYNEFHFYLHGGTITGNGKGVQNKEKMVMSGGAITNNSSSDSGGGVDLEGSYSLFQMQGGTISGNKADGGGGGVYVNGYGQRFEMSGGVIEKNTATSYGGGAEVYQGTVKISGSPVIRDNKVKEAVNNLYVYEESRSVLRVASMTEGANIGLSTNSEDALGVLEYGTDESVAQYFHLDTGGKVTAVDGSLKVARAPVITNVSASWIEGNKVQISFTTDRPGVFRYQANSVPEEYNGWSDGPEITEAGNVTFTLNIQEGYYFLFKVQDKVSGLWSNTASIQVPGPHKHKLCGATDACTHGGGDHSETPTQLFLPLTERSLYESGYYFLTMDTDLEQIAVYGTEDKHTSVVLCLNGHTLKCNTDYKDLIYVSSYANLIICDCQGVGEIDGNGKSPYGVNSEKNSVVSIYGGTIHSFTRGNYSAAVHNLGRVNLYGGSLERSTVGVECLGDLHMYGGEIKNNTSSESGAGVRIRYTNNATCNFYMYGGKITGNTSGGSGGGVYLRTSGANMVMSGGEITGNKAAVSGGGVEAYWGKMAVSGTAKINGNTLTDGETASNIYLYTKRFSSFSVEELDKSALLGISSDNSDIISQTGGAYVDRFVSDAPDGRIYTDAEKQALMITYESDNVVPVLTVGMAQREAAPSNKAEVSFTASEPGTYYYCMTTGEASVPGSDFTTWDKSGASTGGLTTFTIECSRASDVKLHIGMVDAAGNKSDVMTMYIYGNHQHQVCGGKSGCSHAGDDHTGTAPTYQPLIIEGGEYTFESGHYFLVGDISVDRLSIGSGVDVKLCLNGHKLRATDLSASCISVNNGTLTFCDCRGTGQVYTRGAVGNTKAFNLLNSGTLNLYGGTITGFTSAYGNGAAIEIRNSDTVNMYGGTLTGNNLGLIGYGTFNLYGGLITENHNPTDSGGGVRLTGNGARMNMYGGTISNNSANGGGGGIYSNANVNVTMTGGTITGNKATSTGGGIELYPGSGYSGDAITLSGTAKIDDNYVVDANGNQTEENLYLYNTGDRTNTIKIGEMKTGAKVGVTVRDPSQRFCSTGGAYTQYFFSDDQNYSVQSYKSGSDYGLILKATFVTYDLTETTVAIVGYNGTAEHLVIPSVIDGKTVTEIGWNKQLWETGKTGPFENDTNLKSVTFPDTIVSLNKWAFRQCTNLEEVNLNEGLEYIGEGSLQELAITSITLPSTVKEIGCWGLSRNYKLTEVNLNKGLEVILYNAFHKCTSLEEIEIPDGVKFLDKRLFLGNTELKTVTIPASVTEIRSSAFSQTALTEIRYGGTVDQLAAVVIDDTYDQGTNDLLYTASVTYSDGSVGGLMAAGTAYGVKNNQLTVSKPPQGLTLFAAKYKNGQMKSISAFTTAGGTVRVDSLVKLFLLNSTSQPQCPSRTIS